MKKRFRFVSLPLLLCFLLTAVSCTEVKNGEQSEAQAYYQFTDDSGNAVTLPQKPQKVAVLFSSFADIWTVAGGEIAITVGESVERGFAPADILLVDAGAGKTVNTELLISYAPDFVIASADIAAQAQAADLLRQAKIPTALFRVESFADYLRVLKICTDITGNAEAYKTHGSDQQSKIENLLSGIPQDTKQPKILFIRAGSSSRSTKAKTAAEHFACGMLEELGCDNIADRAPILLDGLSIEAIMTEDPDVIFITTMGDADAAQAYMETLFQDPTWQTLSAVKNENYHFLSKDLFQFKPNAHWYEAYCTLTEILYETTD